MNGILSPLLRVVEQDRVPDWAIRLGMRYFIRKSLQKQSQNGDVVAQKESARALIAQLQKEPIAAHTAEANAQHYELPTEFFLAVLGPRLKYSSCLYQSPDETLAQAEENMLALSCQRAQVEDGMSILELGCGWGSLSLWLCEKYPNARIVAVSNSRTQRAYIMDAAAKRGFKNLEVVTADMNDFDTTQTFDRVMSIEMFEHMRNYECLMQKVAGWLKPEGKLFVHIFTNRQYPFMVNAQNNWLAQYFFTGGVSPSDDLLLYFQRDLHILDHWRVNGAHYARTLEAWLKTFDEKRKSLEPLFESTYGKKDMVAWIVRWRMFFMSCAELMGFNKGNAYIISHYLFGKRG
jgi:cyclopropane-fatty-acyl-phospholipid synthase